MSILIHGVPPSPFVRKVRVFLAEKNVPYELKAQQPFGQSDEYLAISPLGKVPCFQDGDFTVPDSSVICAYVERTNPEPALYPSDPKEYAQALWHEEYADSRLAEVCAGPFFQRIVRPLFFQQEPDEAIVTEIVNEKQPPAFDYLEGVLEDGSEALVGGRFSIADVAAGSMLAQLVHADLDIDANRWPKLAAYRDAIHGRPSFKSCIEEEKAIFASLKK
ncbi:MAG: glutathione S-transferase family protein [Deltaproteobacteria bacterium]|nr:glutathione S-transferase family protein [Deltaproteobacteria bacterium]MBW2446323.1 glutathione S-transferase family protein [Deltaproteobacteria bacterium]